MPLLIPTVGCVSAIDERAKIFNDDGVAMFAHGDFSGGARILRPHLH